MIYVFLADGFEEIEALAPVDILRRAGKQVQTVGVGKREITGRSNIKVIADIEVSEIKLGDDLEMIILPGGMPGTTNLEASLEVRKTISFCYDNDIFIAAICAAPSILGKMGLLKDKRATCYPGFEKFLEGAKVCNAGVVADGKLITANGAGKSIAFALKLAEVLCGGDKANEISRSVCYEEI
jgi:4-methyl-5(b-hydroxyethyl)-thiazole monophosphate biosynthesis